MERISISPRNNWQQEVEKLGFGFHTTNIPYWDESAYYRFSMKEILFIENATVELWGMCLEAVQHVIDNDLYAKFAIPESAIDLIETSWREDAPAIYGRFDFGFDGENLKMFEFNADTPTSLFEAAIVQWFWLQDFDKNKDQFNSLHEKLIAYWGYLKPYLHKGKLSFTCIRQSLEDLTTAEYLRDCAIQAGLETELLYIDEVGWDTAYNIFVNNKDELIANIFKLYPWEWLIKEPFADNLFADRKTCWIEPAWKMILSNKAILPVLYKLFPKCPYILPSFFENENTLSNFARKPILSREGANVQLLKSGNTIAETEGAYGGEGFICQALFEIPKFDGKTPVLGSWIVGQEAAGMGIRECDGQITGNTSCFIPHLISE